MLKIRRPLGRLIFNMGIAIPGKTVFLIETAPWIFFVNVYKCQHMAVFCCMCPMAISNPGASAGENLYCSLLVSVEVEIGSLYKKSCNSGPKFSHYTSQTKIVLPIPPGILCENLQNSHFCKSASQNEQCENILRSYTKLTKEGHFLITKVTCTGKSTTELLGFLHTAVAFGYHLTYMYMYVGDMRTCLRALAAEPAMVELLN